MPKGIYERTPEQRERLGAMFRKGKMTVCPICGKETYKTAAQLRKVRKSEAGYCSRSCRAKANHHLLDYCDNGKGKPNPKKGLRLEQNPAWKGGVTFKRNKGNYIGPKYVRCPPEFVEMARADGYVMEHRLVMATMLGRVLKRSEAVHHVDHNTRNNDPTNLMLFATNAQHKIYEGQEARRSGQDIDMGGKV